MNVKEKFKSLKLLFINEDLLMRKVQSTHQTQKKLLTSAKST